MKSQIKRIPTSHIPREVATRALLSPRITGKSRKLFMRARDCILDVERSEPRDEKERYCEEMRRLSIKQLRRRAIQMEHSFAETERTRAVTELETPRKMLEQYIALLKYRYGWLMQEADRRANGVLKETIDDKGN